jgi:hypothetical protein
MLGSESDDTFYELLRRYCREVRSKFGRIEKQAP